MYVLDELNNSDKAELEKHLENSAQARKELENIQSLFKNFSVNRPGEINEDILINSRQNLLRQIRIDGVKENIFIKTLHWLEQVNISGFKLAASSVSAIVVGVVIGFLIFGSNSINTSSDSPLQAINIDNIINSDRNLSNISFDTDPASGIIQISFDAVKSLTYNGDMNDEVVKYLLASALLNNRNPGARLRTVQTIVEQTANTDNPDPKIKTALITSLKNDSNPAVRKAALEALKNYSYDNEIRDAILYVLSNDTNSGLRVNAINALAGLKIAGISIDDKIKNALNNRIINEENGFIKYRAATLLKGEE